MLSRKLVDYISRMDWKDYEKITKDIYETLGKESGVKIECYGNDCKVRGNSGVEHQIDVLASHSDGIHKYKTAIECKYWKSTINKDTVMKILSIIEDSKIEKGVIISKKGFTPDAISFAKSKNIGLALLREVEKEDYGRDLPIFEILPSIVSTPKIIEFQMISKEGANRGDERVKISKMELVDSKGRKSPLKKWIDHFYSQLRKEKAIEPITIEYKFDDISLNNIETSESTPIESIVMTGVIEEREIDLGWKQMDKTWLIMKSVFEDKIITVSEKGVIKESKFRFIN